MRTAATHAAAASASPSPPRRRQRPSTASAAARATSVKCSPRVAPVTRRVFRCQPPSRLLSPRASVRRPKVASAPALSTHLRYLAVVYNDSDSSSKRRRPFESRRRSRSWRVTTGSGSSTTRDAREDYFDAVVNCRAYCRLTSLNVTQMISESTAGFTRATLC